MIAHMPFPIGGPLDQASISNGFRDIQRRKNFLFQFELLSAKKYRATQPDPGL